MGVRPGRTLWGCSGRGGEDRAPLPSGCGPSHKRPLLPAPQPLGLEPAWPSMSSAAGVRESKAGRKLEPSCWLEASFLKSLLGVLPPSAVLCCPCLALARGRGGGRQAWLTGSSNQSPQPPSPTQIDSSRSHRMPALPLSTCSAVPPSRQGQGHFAEGTGPPGPLQAQHCPPRQNAPGGPERAPGGVRTARSRQTSWAPTPALPDQDPGTAQPMRQPNAPSPRKPREPWSSPRPSVPWTQAARQVAEKGRRTRAGTRRSGSPWEDLSLLTVTHKSFRPPGTSGMGARRGAPWQDEGDAPRDRQGLGAGRRGSLQPGAVGTAPLPAGHSLCRLGRLASSGLIFSRWGSRV